MRKIYGRLAGRCLLALPVQAGGYNPVPEGTEAVFPESDGNAGIAALVVFGVIFAVGIVQIAAKKWRDRGDGDKG